MKTRVTLFGAEGKLVGTTDVEGDLPDVLLYGTDAAYVRDSGSPQDDEPEYRVATVGQIASVDLYIPRE
jgi:hypothetical protein